MTDVYQVTTLGTLHGMPCDHVVNWHVAGGGPNVQLLTNGFPAADVASWTASMLQLLPADYELTGSRCVYLGDTTTTPAEDLTNAPGTSTAAFGVYSSAVTWRWPAPGRGKGKDGRTNAPGPELQYLDVDHHHINAAGVTAYTAAWGDYFTGVASRMTSPSWGNPTVVILSRKKGTFALPQAGQFDPYANTHRRWVKRLARH